MNLHSSHSHFPSSWKHFQFFVFTDGAGNKSAGDHRPEALHRKHAIDGQARDRLESLGSTSAAAPMMACFKLPSPAPVNELTGTMGAFGDSRNFPRKNSS